MPKRGNRMYKIIWDFEIETDPLILASGTDFMFIIKKKRHFSWWENENKKKKMQS